MVAGQAYLLIVEDDPDILNLLKTTLEFNGYRVSTARNGLEGLEAVQAERPAMVIADILMPRLDGFGLVNRLRIHPETRDIPVALVTATYVTLEDREFAQNIGATRFIQKPIDLEKLLATIKELLEQGVHIGGEPLKDAEFYEGYRKRLEAKRDQKVAQIARDELLLQGTLSDEERLDLLASVDHAIIERREIELLLEQIREQLTK
ncbi:MAG: response regulator [Anaerolineae bacterium]